MAQDYNLRGRVTISGTPDEDGDVQLSAYSCTVFMTRKEMREMRDHLNSLLGQDVMRKDGRIYAGVEVKVIKTSHKDLLGETGVVACVTPSGNYEVYFHGGSESVILGPQQVERV